MNSPKDGGPAFPHTVEYRPNTGELPVRYGGMSLRDWFAGQALAGSLSSAEVIAATQTAAKNAGVKTGASMAEYCYDYADFMLAERAKAQ